MDKEQILSDFTRVLKDRYLETVYKGRTIGDIKVEITSFEYDNFGSGGSHDQIDIYVKYITPSGRIQKEWTSIYLC